MTNSIQLQQHPKLAWGLLLLAGIIYPLAFAPYATFPLAIISVALFFCCLQHTTAKQAFFRGWAYGLLIFLIGCYWLFISAHNVAGAPAVLSAVLVVLFAGLVGLFPAIFAYIMQKLLPDEFKFKWLLFASGAWTILAFVRCHLFTGFAWLILGYSQTGHTLSGSASIIGLYGVTWVAAIVAGIICETIYYNRQKSYRNKLILALLLIFIVSALLQAINWTHKVSHKISVSMLQGNITQSLKWDPAKLDQNIAIYKKMTTKALGSQFIIWPESAIPLFSYQLKNLLTPLAELAKKNGSSIFASVPYMDRSTGKYYNSIILLGNSSGKYFKTHLVPFGEYFPLQFIAGPILSALKIPMNNFTAGKADQKLLISNGIKIAAFICYEITYPDLVLKQADNANILLTVSDDGWFGNSIALFQHLEMAAFQAESLQKPLLFASNNGITAAINKKGIIVKQLPINKRLILKTQVQPRAGKTPLQYFGYIPIWIIILLGMNFAATRRRSKKQ